MRLQGDRDKEIEDLENGYLSIVDSLLDNMTYEEFSIFMHSNEYGNPYDPTYDDIIRVMSLCKNEWQINYCLDLINNLKSESVKKC